VANAVWIPERTKPGPTGLNARKRARKFGVAYEPVDKRKVFTRDNWRCGICREKVDKRLRWPHQMAASLDHVVPLSRGGSHTYANTQCAHSRCNSAKSNGGHGEQLALI
jgi:5-methylcytosine-specific restriction endonuclease McrA